MFEDGTDGDDGDDGDRFAEIITFIVSTYYNIYGVSMFGR
jgi:hypothetical protein